MKAVNAHRRFKILSRARSGSNLLISHLRNHGNLKIYVELFNLNSLSDDDMVAALNNHVRYLEKHIYRDYPASVNMVGFKMFYDHAKRRSLLEDLPPYTHRALKKRVDSFKRYVKSHYDIDELTHRLEQVWNYLRDDTALKIIHLKRRNKLETLLSLKRAYISNEWEKNDMIKTILFD